MRSVFSLGLFLLLFLDSFSQTFTGYLEYVVETKLLSGSGKEANSQIDTISYFYSDNGDYLFKSALDTSFFSLYKVKDNLLYTFDNDIEYVLAIDAGIDNEEKLLGTAPEIKPLDSVYIINDRTCKAVQVKWRSGIYTYFYSPGFLVTDPDIYKNYKYDQWYKYLLLSHALPVRIIKLVNGLSETTYNLVFYSSQNIDPEIFELPKIKEVKGLGKLYPLKRVFIYK